jgi:hypothetical protein
MIDLVDIASDDGLVMVSLEYCGEGLHGDYSANDPNDVPLMRFSIFRKVDCDNLCEYAQFEQCCEHGEYEHGDWAMVRNSSNLTSLDARTPRAQLEVAAKAILNTVHDLVKDYRCNSHQYATLAGITIHDNKVVLPTV